MYVVKWIRLKWQENLEFPIFYGAVKSFPGQFLTYLGDVTLNEIWKWKCSSIKA